MQQNGRLGMTGFRMVVMCAVSHLVLLDCVQGRANVDTGDWGMCMQACKLSMVSIPTFDHMEKNARFLPLLTLRGGAADKPLGTKEWASLLGIGDKKKAARGKRGASIMHRGGSVARDVAEPDGPKDKISQTIAEKEAQVEKLLGELDQGGSAKADEHDESGSSEVDLALHLAPLSKEELEEMIARLVHWRSEIGQRVLEIARRPFDVAAIPYRVEQLCRARASAVEFAGIF